MVGPNVNCKKCNSTAIAFLKARDVNRKTTDKEYQYDKCLDCKLIFLRNIPTKLSEAYTNEYHLIPQSMDQFVAAAQYERPKIEILKRFVQKGKLLEIGPSIGLFAYLAKQEGFDVEAIEMDPACCKFLNEKIKIPTTETKNIAQYCQNKHYYDAVVLWQVIEHLEDPWSDLKSIVSALSNNGFLFISTPNPQSFQFRLFKSRWTHVDAPRHFYLIPISLLIQYLSSLGLKHVYTSTNDPSNLQWNEFGWKYSLSSLTLNKFKDKLLRKIGSFLSKLFRPIESINGLGSSYTIVFKKGD